ncbi:ion channel [Pseudotenacibaculum sp. MALMAid0570]|uniref:ion channel n=1 Tax=Pseudotenacibaculum sp. MALMAid0570 TaxID=3143938 RepID=UPI0032DFCD9D
MAKKVKDPGFGYRSSKNARKFINEDGTSNVIHVNRKRGLYDLYAHLIDIPWWQFFLFVFLVYTIINILFAVLYNIIGIEQITPSTGNLWNDLLNGFFFSAQTITTVGYGGIAPQGLTANIIASFQAMIGLMGFSFITGLLYGRFSKPKAVIKFSKNIIVRDFKEHRAIMFRLMNSRKNMMIEPQITVTLSITEFDEKTDNYKRNFYQLKLERDKIMYLPTMWTIVHELDTESPLSKYTNEELQSLDAEMYILLQYHDEAFSQRLFKIYSYKFEQLVADVQFESSFRFNESGDTILDHDKLDQLNQMN